MRRFRVGFALAAAGVVAVHWSGAAQAYTTEQAAAGRQTFQDTCATCHGANLRNLPNAILAPPEFSARWTGRTTTDLLLQLKATMPPEAPGSLPEASYLNVIAFLLQTNGFAANNAPLTVASSAVLGSDALASARPAAEPIGVTVAGTVRDFAPVPERELANPAAGDWPMLRRDYAASSYSPDRKSTRLNSSH